MLLKVLLLFVYLFHGQINCNFLDKFTRLRMHFKCRNKYYPGANNTVARTKVSNEEVPWRSKPAIQYRPPCYTARTILEQQLDWADPVLNKTGKNTDMNYNMHLTTYNRVCCGHIYSVKNDCPLNPVGRTGLGGRGMLGRWGPNQQVHVVFARWKRDCSNLSIVDEKSNRRVFEFLSVKRADCGQWSVPGRFIGHKEKFLSTMKKCFVKECLNKSSVKSQIVAKKLKNLFSKGSLIYRGYVDDPRNTDNAWISTTGMLFVNEKRYLDEFVMSPGPGILEVKWMETPSTVDENFYANHAHFIRDAARYLDAHFPSEDVKSTNLFNRWKKTVKKAKDSPEVAKEYDYYSSSVEGEDTQAGIAEYASFFRTDENEKNESSFTINLITGPVSISGPSFLKIQKL